MKKRIISMVLATLMLGTSTFFAGRTTTKLKENSQQIVVKDKTSNKKGLGQVLLSVIDSTVIGAAVIGLIGAGIYWFKNSSNNKEIDSNEENVDDNNPNDSSNNKEKEIDSNEENVDDNNPNGSNNKEIVDNNKEKEIVDNNEENVDDRLLCPDLENKVTVNFNVYGKIESFLFNKDTTGKKFKNFLISVRPDIYVKLRFANFF